METFHCAQKLIQPTLLELKQEPELSPTQSENNGGTGEEHESAGEHYGSNAVSTVTISSQSKQQETHPTIAQPSTSSQTSSVFSHGSSNTFQENHPVNLQHPPDVNIAQVQFPNFPDKTNFLPGPIQYPVVQPPVAHQHNINRNVPRLFNDTELHNQVLLSGDVNDPNADNCTFTNQPLNLVSSSSSSNSNNNSTNRRQSEAQGDGDTCSSGGSNAPNKQSRSPYGILPENRDLVLLLDACDQQNTDSSRRLFEASSSAQDGSSSRNYQRDGRTLGNRDKAGQDVNDGSSPWNGRLLPVSLLSDAGRDSGERLGDTNSVDC